MINDKLIAHRGWQRRYPENTLLGIEQALELGAQHIEIDLQLTADQVPVLCHDQTLERLCGSPVNINQSEFRELAPLSAYEPGRLGDQFLGTPFSTLEQCIKLLMNYPGVTLYIEIKSESVMTFGPAAVFDAIYPLISSTGLNCFLISFDLTILNYFKGQQWQKVVPVLSSWDQAFSEEVQILNPPLLFSDILLIPEGQSPADLPFPCAFYEIDTIEAATQWLKQGAALIETFAIGEMLAAYNP